MASEFTGATANKGDQNVPFQKVGRLWVGFGMPLGRLWPPSKRFWATAFPLVWSPLVCLWSPSCCNSGDISPVQTRVAQNGTLSFAWERQSMNKELNNKSPRA